MLSDKIIKTQKTFIPSKCIADLHQVFSWLHSPLPHKKTCNEKHTSNFLGYKNWGQWPKFTNFLKLSLVKSDTSIQVKNFCFIKIKNYESSTKTQIFICYHIFSFNGHQYTWKICVIIINFWSVTAMKLIVICIISHELNIC